ncbi:MAG TPA: DUF4149 domain-containing protein [Vicinamibacterales bacterium]|nr:DUF4149 domain-containing protein [Vicinamibacterales bacterium]
MALLRFASLIVIGAWVSGLAIIGFVVAPTTFAVLDDAHGGRQLAGRIVGAVLGRFDQVAWTLGGLLLLLLILRAVLGPRPRRFAWRVSVAAVMLGLSLTGGLWIAPQVAAIRDAAPGAVADLPDTDSRKAQFGRLHGISTTLAMVTMLGGVWLMWMEMRDESATQART